MCVTGAFLVVEALWFVTLQQHCSVISEIKVPCYLKNGYLLFKTDLFFLKEPIFNYFCFFYLVVAEINGK